MWWTSRIRLDQHPASVHSGLCESLSIRIKTNFLNIIIYCMLYTSVLGVASKQLRLLRGRGGDSTTVVNSLSPQISELVEDAIAS